MVFRPVTRGSSRRGTRASHDLLRPCGGRPAEVTSVTLAAVIRLSGASRAACVVRLNPSTGPESSACGEKPDEGQERGLVRGVVAHRF